MKRFEVWVSAKRSQYASLYRKVERSIKSFNSEAEAEAFASELNAPWRGIDSWVLDTQRADSQEKSLLVTSW